MKKVKIILSYCTLLFIFLFAFLLQMQQETLNAEMTKEEHILGSTSSNDESVTNPNKEYIISGNGTNYSFNIDNSSATSENSFYVTFNNVSWTNSNWSSAFTITSSASYTTNVYITVTGINSIKANNHGGITRNGDGRVNIIFKTYASSSLSLSSSDGSAAAISNSNNLLNVRYDSPNVTVSNFKVNGNTASSFDSMITSSYVTNNTSISFSLNHTHSFANNYLKTKPTISSTGVFVQTCSYDNIDNNIVIPKLSDTSFWTCTKNTEPTYSNDGSYSYSSSQYGGLTLNNISVPKLSNSSIWHKTVTTEASFSNNGTYSYSSDYGTITLSIPSLSNEIWQETRNKETTISEDGSYTYSSSNYPDIVVTIPNLKNSIWTKEIIKEPTYVEDGSYKYSSTIGDVIVTIPSLKNNLWSLDMESKVDPTLLNTGVYQYTSEYGAVQLNLPLLAEEDVYTKQLTTQPSLNKDAEITYIYKELLSIIVHANSLKDIDIWSYTIVTNPTTTNTGKVKYENSEYGVFFEEILPSLPATPPTTTTPSSTSYGYKIITYSTIGTNGSALYTLLINEATIEYTIELPLLIIDRYEIDAEDSHMYEYYTDGTRKDLGLVSGAVEETSSLVSSALNNLTDENSPVSSLTKEEQEQYITSVQETIKVTSEISNLKESVTLKPVSDEIKNSINDFMDKYIQILMDQTLDVSNGILSVEEIQAKLVEAQKIATVALSVQDFKDTPVTDENTNVTIDKYANIRLQTILRYSIDNTLSADEVIALINQIDDSIETATSLTSQSDITVNISIGEEVDTYINDKISTILDKALENNLSTEEISNFVVLIEDVIGSISDLDTTLTDYKTTNQNQTGFMAETNYIHDFYNDKFNELMDYDLEDLSNLDFDSFVSFVDDVADGIDTVISSVRNCDGSKFTQFINKTVSSISVTTYRDYDKEAMDEAFYQAAKEAIYLHVQAQCINMLDQNYQNTIVNKKYNSKELIEIKKIYEEKRSMLLDDVAFRELYNQSLAILENEGSQEDAELISKKMISLTTIDFSFQPKLTINDIVTFSIISLSFILLLVLYGILQRNKKRRVTL